jgi:hypothetical protein
MNRKEVVKQIENMSSDFCLYKWIPMNKDDIEDYSGYIHFHIIKNIGYTEIEKRAVDICKVNYVYYIEYQIIGKDPYMCIQIKDTDTLLNMRNLYGRKISQYSIKLQRIEECLKNISRNLSLEDNLI